MWRRWVWGHEYAEMTGGSGGERSAGIIRRTRISWRVRVTWRTRTKRRAGIALSAAACVRNARCAASILVLSISTWLVTACATNRRVAVEPIITDRPDFTESSQTVPGGMVQFEGGSTHARGADALETSIGEVLLRTGMNDWSEFRLGLNSYSFARTSGESTQGFEDASLGAKFRLMRGGATGSLRPTLSLIAATSVPTGSRPFRSSRLLPELKLGAEWDLSARVSVATNLNYSWVHDAGVRWTEPSFSASAGVALTEKVGSYLEYFGFYPELRGAPNTHFGNGGLTYSLTDDFQIDARLGRELTRSHDGATYFFGLGFARRW